MEDVVYTIGHSNHAPESFGSLLRLHGITALGDVRSRPYSRFNPHFNREELAQSLRDRGISYVFLGNELGARSEDPNCYDSGRVQFARLADTEQFQRGLERVRNGMHDFRLVLMCAEKEPLECHRTILVARHLAASGVRVQHILEDGRLESHGEALNRLLRMLKWTDHDMFRTRDQVLEDAYFSQEERIAFEGEGAIREGTFARDAG
jgi:uncharacterized protein (DUF488 family)